MEFDPVGTAQLIPSMIKNNTLIDVLDQNQLCECLKQINLNLDDSLYIINKVQSKYTVTDRFKALHHIFIEINEDTLNSTKFVEFTRALGKCLHFDILDSFANIFESVFLRNDQISPETKQKSQKPVTKTTTQGQNQQISTSQPKKTKINKNIEELKRIEKSKENFDKIYDICQRIASRKDRNAMTFAIKENFVYVTEKGNFDRSIFTKAASDNNQELIGFMIKSGIDVNARDNKNCTALIRASYKGNLEVVKLLIAVPGIDVNAKDMKDWTALIRASERGHQEIVKLLLSVPGIDINAKSKFSNTALKLASPCIAQLLQENGAV